MSPSPAASTLRSTSGEDAQAAYLDLLKSCLTRSLFDERYARLGRYDRVGWKHALFRPVQRLLAVRQLEIVRKLEVDSVARLEGRVWPVYAETMIGHKRLDNLQAHVTDVLRRNIPGDLIETGVWRGGATIFMRAILKAYGDQERNVWVADSFDGLPAPDAGRWPADRGDTHSRQTYLAVSQDEVRNNFKRYGLLDDRVKFLPGRFEDTLLEAPIDQLALLRLDGDMYGSTMVALESLYPKLSAGGYVIVDDFRLPGCQQAVNDYRARHEIQDPIERIDDTGVWWLRSPATAATA